MMLQPGDLILNGKYRIEELAGKGAFAEVYRAMHLKLNVPRAIKVLRVDAPGVGSTTFNGYRARYRQEFQIASRIDHPNVIKVHDLVEEQGVLYAVLEYATGGSVKDLIAEAGALPVEHAVEILLDCTAGLGALHDQLGVIHRDVKPSNILLDADGRAKIADLGLAQVGGAQSSMRSELGSEAGMHPGTALYRSPEHNSWEPLTPTSDVYSLGCVAFEMLTGQVWKQVMHQAEHVRELRVDIPEWLNAIVVRMLCNTPGLLKSDADTPHKRYVAMRACGAEIRDGIKYQQEAWRPAPTPRRPSPPLLKSAFTGLLLLGGCILLIWGIPVFTNSYFSESRMSVLPFWLAVTVLFSGIISFFSLRLALTIMFFLAAFFSFVSGWLEVTGSYTVKGVPREGPIVFGFLVICIVLICILLGMSIMSAQRPRKRD